MYLTSTPCEYGNGTAFNFANRMADSLDRVVVRNPAKVEYANTVEDVERMVGEGKIAAFRAIEGGHMPEDLCVCFKKTN